MTDQLTMIDVLRAITLLVGDKFPQYPVNDRDVNEDFPRPSSFVDISDVSSEMIAQTIEEETAQVSLYFFEETVYAGFLRLLELKTSVLDAFMQPLVASNEDGTHSEHILLEGVRCIVSKADKALQVDFSVTLHTSHKPSDEDLPLMEELSYDGRAEDCR